MVGPMKAFFLFLTVVFNFKHVVMCYVVLSDIQFFSLGMLICQYDVVLNGVVLNGVVSSVVMTQHHFGHHYWTSLLDITFDVTFGHNF